MAYEREFLSELRGITLSLRNIDVSLRALRGPLSPEEGIVAQEPIQDGTPPQGGTTGRTRLTEPTEEALRAYGAALQAERSTPEGDWEAYKEYANRRVSGGLTPAPYKDWRTEQQAKRLQETGEASSRLVEKLLNPEGH